MLDPATLLTPETIGPAILVGAYLELRLASKIRSALPCRAICPAAKPEPAGLVDQVAANVKTLAIVVCAAALTGCGGTLNFLGDVNRDADVDAAYVTRIQKAPGKATPTITIRSLDTPEELDETPAK